MPIPPKSSTALPFRAFLLEQLAQLEPWSLIEAPLTGSSGVRQNSVGSNMRLLVRGRSKPSGSGLKLRSAYAFPAGRAPAARSSSPRSQRRGR